MPIEGDPNLKKKVGSRVAKEIMETHRKTLLNQQVKLDPFEYWEPNCITVWKKQLEPAKKIEEVITTSFILHTNTSIRTSPMVIDYLDGT